MKCPNCGEEYDLGINFCKRCEAILEAIELKETSTSPETSSEKPSQEALRLSDEDTFDRKVIKKKEEVKEIREEIQRSLVRAVIKELLLIKDEKKRYERLLQSLEERRVISRRRPTVNRRPIMRIVSWRLQNGLRN